MPKKKTAAAPAKKTAAAPAKKKKGKPSTRGKVVGHVEREPGAMYFVDGVGDVRRTVLSRTGGKKGRHVCR